MFCNHKETVQGLYYKVLKYLYNIHNYRKHRFQIFHILY